MGLSGRKIKQRIPQDPRNLSWAEDASRFGSTYLSKLGFDHSDKNATLGVSGVGLAQHLKVHHKLDMLGIGAQHAKDPNGIAWKQNRDFENLLKRLNANLENPAENGIDAAPIEGFQPARGHESAARTPSAGPATVGREDDEKVEEKRKSKKKKRRRRDDEATEPEERKPKKRKQVESESVTATSEPVEVCPSSSNSPVPKTFPTSRKPHRHSRAHRARFIASKRLAATSSTAVAEILGIPSSSITTPLDSSNVTPEVTPPVEVGEHGHLMVSSKTVGDYFKEKMRLITSKPLSFESMTDEAPRGGIGSRLEVHGRSDAEEGGELHDSLGRSLLAKMTSMQEIPGGKREQKERSEKKRKSGGNRGAEDQARVPKKGSRKRTQVASD